MQRRSGDRRQKMAKLSFASIVLVLLTVINCNRGVHGTKSSVLKNGAYEDIRVWLHPDVPDSQETLDALTKLFKAASPIMHTAMHGEASIRSVRVIVPFVWSPVPGKYDVGGGDEVKNDFADFRLTASSVTAPRAETAGSKICGHEGDYITLGTGTIQKALTGSPAELTQLAKELVAAWAQHRYGVFSEQWDNSGKFANDTKSNFPFKADDACESEFFEAFGLTPSPTTCGLVEPDEENNYYDDAGNVCNPCAHVTYEQCESGNCSRINPPDACYKFRTTNEVVANHGASLMSSQTDERIVRFCDDTDEHPHNAEARNLHNFYCDLQPIMSVIKQHSDFAPHKGHQPRTEPAIPSVTFVRDSDAQPTVLVLDTSGSMQLNLPTRLSVLMQAVNGLINCMKPGDNKPGVPSKPIAIVDFSEPLDIDPPMGNARIVQTLTNITDVTIKQISRTIERLRVHGGTPIGAGILQGIEALGGVGSPGCRNAKMLIVTDGEENVDPLVSDPIVQEAIRGCNLTIDALLISNEADSIVLDLALSTGGEKYTINPNNDDWFEAGSKALSEMCQSSRTSEEKASISQVESKTMNIPQGVPITGALTIDATLGVNTAMILSNQNFEKTVLAATVCSPSGQCINESDTSSIAGVSYETSAFGVTVRIAVAQPGKWRYTLSTKTRTGLESASIAAVAGSNVSLVVTSERQPDAQPITLVAWYERSVITDVRTQPMVIYAKLLKGIEPVRGASVKVVVSTAKKSVVTLDMRDDGSGADLGINDGIYTALFTKYDGVGRYSTAVTADDNGGQASTATTSVGEFRRVFYGELFTVDDADAGKKIDFSPPAKIDSLSAAVADSDMKTVRLAWTATGDDGYTGTATSYTLAFSSDVKKLISSFSTCDNIVNPTVPLSAGSQQAVTVSVAGASFPVKIGDMVYFAIVSKDDASNTSPRSNIASVRFFNNTKRFVSTTTGPTTELHTLEPTTTEVETQEPTTTPEPTTETPEPTTTQTETPEPTTTQTETPEPTTTETPEPTTTETETPEPTTTETPEPTTTETPEPTTTETETPEPTTTETPEPTTTETETPEPTSTEPQTTSEFLFTSTPEPVVTVTESEPVVTMSTTEMPPQSTTTEDKPVSTTSSSKQCKGMSCWGKPNGNYADPEIPCTQHYCACSNGILYVMPCAANLYFDERRRICLNRYEVPACA